MKKKYKALIVDDEQLARKDLWKVLKKFDYVEIVDEASNLQQAEKFIKSYKPDIVFLDIQLPSESGFELLDKIPKGIHVIFVTAFDKYAIKAFEVNALDYLLKPVNPERLKNSLDRIIDGKSSQGDKLERLDYDDSIFLMFQNKYNFLKINSILSITAEADYTKITTLSMEKGLAHKTMKEWENRLPKRRFIRIHRSVIVNSDYIDRIEEWFNYSYKVFIKGIFEPFIMSKRYAQKNKNKLG